MLTDGRFYNLDQPAKATTGKGIMGLKIRLTRLGAKKTPYYRIIVADSRSPRDGRFIEQVGTYDPKAESDKVNLKADKIKYWLNQGATPTVTVRSILVKAGLGAKAAKGAAEAAPTA